MNPYDRRAVRSVWARVMPGRDVFAPGIWPAPPSTGRGGLPPTPDRDPEDGRSPVLPGQGGWQQGADGRSMPPGQGGWQQPGQGSGAQMPRPGGGSQPGQNASPTPPERGGWQQGQGGWQQPGQGGRPPMPPGQGGWQQPGQGGSPPMPPGQSGWQPGQDGRPNPPGWQRPPVPEGPSAAARLLELAAGYDALARRYRSPGLRQMAAQCRRGESALRNRCDVHGTYAGTADTTLQTQRERESALRRSLEALPPSCAQLAGQLMRESQYRSRQLSRMR